MSDWQQGDVYSGGVRVHFYRTGQGDKTPLLLAHGFSDNGLCWTPTAQVLMDDFDVVMVDARNHGQSDAGAADIKSLADDLAAVVTQLELGAVSALGHSVGASVVTALAADYPHLVNRLLLEDPPWRQPQSKDSIPRKKRKSNKGSARPRDAAFRKLVAQMAQFSEAKMLQHGHTQHPTWQDADYAPWGLSNRQVS
ncbi:MAG: alpha/beta hydrolase, partial [Pseudomonadota bacterium]|nr:alpha/beta hydrolase [Pseudomonadota bacterium]